MTILLPEEAPVELYVNEILVATFYCTPRELLDLAVGYLLSSGMISKTTQIERLFACEEVRSVHVSAPDAKPDRRRLGQVIYAGCGQEPTERPGGEEGIFDNYPLFPLTVLQEACTQMLTKNLLYRKHGAIHAAALCALNGTVFTAEDIGRHNALDKAIGKAARSGCSFRDCALVTTGRLSSEMVTKAFHAGISVAATLSLPTGLAASLAERYGMALVGRVQKKDPPRIVRADRIV